jgi:hypothetical protein
VPRYFFELTNDQSNDADDPGIVFAQSSEASTSAAIALAQMLADQLRHSNPADNITMLIRDEARSPLVRLTISCTVQLLAAE